MNRITLWASLLAVFLAAPALAQPALPTPSTPAPISSAAPITSSMPLQKAGQIETFKYARGIEWGGYHDQLTFEATLQPDGSYLVNVGGEKQVKRTGVVLSAADLAGVVTELEALKGFPTGSFAGAGNHWYTDIDLVGNDSAGDPWTFTRWFYETSTPLDQEAGKLETAVEAVIAVIEQRYTKRINPWTRTINTTVITLKNRYGTPLNVNPMGPSAGSAQPLVKPGATPITVPSGTATPLTKPITPAPTTTTPATTAPATPTGPGAASVLRKTTR